MKSFPQAIAQGGLLPLMIAVFIFTFGSEKTFKFGLGIQEGIYPDKAIDFIESTAYYFLGNFKKAIKKFNRSLELNPEQAVVNSNFGFLYYDLMRYQEAIAKFKKAIEIAPTYSDPYFGLASVYEKLVEKEEAIKYWEKYLSLGKDERWITVAKEHLEKLTMQKTQKQ